MVKTLPFGNTQVNSPGLGCMGMSFGLGTSVTLEEAEPVLLKAIELGCTFWDTAVNFAFFVVITSSSFCAQVVYAAGVNEKLLGDFIRKHNCRE